MSEISNYRLKGFDRHDDQVCVLECSASAENEFGSLEVLTRCAELMCWKIEVKGESKSN